MHQVFHGIEPQLPIDNKAEESKSKRKTGQCEEETIGEQTQTESEKSLNRPLCENDEFNEAYLTTYGFLLDRTIQQKPILVFKSLPEKIVYNFTVDEMKRLLTNVTSTCVVMEAMERNTGAIGHFSNNEDLDVIAVVTNSGVVRSPRNGEYVKILTNMRVFKKSIVKAIRDNISLNESVLSTAIATQNANLNQMLSDKSISSVKFKNEQSWTAYMGSKSDSKFS
jgi:hypothetical protein